MLYKMLLLLAKMSFNSEVFSVAVTLLTVWLLLLHRNAYSS